MYYKSADIDAESEHCMQLPVPNRDGKPLRVIGLFLAQSEFWWKPITSGDGYIVIGRLEVDERQ